MRLDSLLSIYSAIYLENVITFFSRHKPYTRHIRKNEDIFGNFYVIIHRKRRLNYLRILNVWYLNTFHKINEIFMKLEVFD